MPFYEVLLTFYTLFIICMSVLHLLNPKHPNPTLYPRIQSGLYKGILRLRASSSELEVPGLKVLGFRV